MIDDLKFFRWIGPMAAIVLAGCAPAEEGASNGGTDEANDASDGQAESADSIVFSAASGWLSVGSDGSVQTTFLDAGGRYRDFRNGTAADIGKWEARADGSLCFTPDTGRGDCWSAGMLEDDGSSIVTSASGRRVEIKRITYAAPSGDEAAEETGESS